MFAEVVDGTYWTGYCPPFHSHTYVLREIAQTKDWGGDIHWVTTGKEFMESNSMSDVKDYCKENGITLVRRIILRFLSAPEAKYENGMEKIPYYVIPNDIRSKCPTS